LTPASHLIIPGLPKAANVFVETAIAATLGCTRAIFVSSREQQIQPDQFTAFLALNRGVGGQHFAASEHNLALLTAHDIRRIAILVRDPRDAVISFWHHLERPDIKAKRQEASFDTSDRGVGHDYDELAPEQKLSRLANRLFPRFQNWVANWVRAADNAPGLQCHFHHFEQFVADQRGTLRALLYFFGHDIEPVLPAIGETRPGGIDPVTHFRRGRAGSYRDEAPPELVRRFDEGLDRALAARMNWTTTA
jgi:hypothetical protein